MKKKYITGRELRQGTPEERLAPGESVLVQKRAGKRFELKRIDAGEKSILEGLDRILAEIPSAGPRRSVNLSRIIIEERE